MSAKARAIRNLYRLGRVDKSGVKQAVVDGIVTETEFKLITGEDYA